MDIGLYFLSKSNQPFWILLLSVVSTVAVKKKKKNAFPISKILRGRGNIMGMDFGKWVFSITRARGKLKLFSCISRCFWCLEIVYKYMIYFFVKNGTSMSGNWIHCHEFYAAKILKVILNNWSHKTWQHSSIDNW